MKMLCWSSALLAHFILGYTTGYYVHKCKEMLLHSHPWGFPPMYTGHLCRHPSIQTPGHRMMPVCAVNMAPHLQHTGQTQD